MPIASGSGHSMAYILEAVRGTTPASPAFTPIRHTGTTLGLTKDTFQSAELRSDRQISDFRHGTRKVGGNIACEVSAGAHDALFEAAACGTWTANVLKCGTVRRSFTIERKFADIGQYLRYTGCELDGFTLKVVPSGIATVSFAVVGEDQSTASTAIGHASYAAATTGAPFDGFSGSVKEGGNVIAIATEIDLTLANGLTAQYGIGSDVSLESTIGRSNVTGTATLFFEDTAALAKFTSETESSLEFTIGDGTKTLNFKCPRIKYSGAAPDVNDEGPVTLAMPFQALLDASSATNLIITRTA